MTLRECIRARLARHENLFTALWYLHLVRNEEPEGPPARWLKLLRVYLVAAWRQWWRLSPRLCWRHQLAVAAGRLDFRDYRDPRCVRCNPPPEGCW